MLLSRCLVLNPPDLIQHLVHLMINYTLLDISESTDSIFILYEPPMGGSYSIILLDSTRYLQNLNLSALLFKSMGERGDTKFNLM